MFNMGDQIYMFNIGDMKKVLYAKKKRFMMDTKASVKSIQQKIDDAWTAQEEQR